MPHILTLNAGSSSIKFAVYALPGQGGEEPQLKARGLVEGIGSAPRLKEKAADGALIADRLLDPDADHAHALTAALESLAGAIAGMRIVAVGHRVVHGGSRFVAPILLDEAVMVALAARDKAQVDRLYNLAMSMGATDEGKPGPRGDTFYAGYFRDPDGNKLNAFVMG